jgi:hypothetical protein
MEIQNRFLAQQIDPRRTKDHFCLVLESGHGQEMSGISLGYSWTPERGWSAIVPEVVASILAGPIGPITGGGAITGPVVVRDAIL